MKSAWRLCLGFASLVSLMGADVMAASSGANHIRDVRIVPSVDTNDGAVIEIDGTETPSYSVRAADNGTRLFVDLKNADVAGAPAALTEKVGVVGGVLTQAYKSSAGSVTRLTVHLSKGASYRLRTEGNRLSIIVNPQGAAVTKDGVSGAASVRDVRFERVGATDRIVIDLVGTPKRTISTLSDGRVRLELHATRLPESLERALDVSAYKGALKTVQSFGDATSGVTTVEVQRANSNNGSIDGQLREEAGSLVWEFPTSGSDSKGPPQRLGTAIRKPITVAREPAAPKFPRVQGSITDSVETVTGSEQAGMVSSVNAQVKPQARANMGSVRRYHGRHIDLDLKDADIHNILRMLADVGKVNVVTADDVSGTITIRMRNVPWDQALDVVLQAKGLGMVVQGNLIRVAQMAQLQKERELKLEQAKQEYQLTPLETRLIPVSYATAEELQARAKELLSPRGSIAVDERTNVLVTRDIANNLNHIEELVRALDTQTPQVLVEARIVEATSRYLRDVGIQWGGDVTFSEATGNSTGIAFPSKITAAGGNYDTQTPTAGLSPFQRQITTPNFAVNLPATVGTGSGGALGLSFGSVDNALNLGVRLSAAESSGLLRVVSSPRILTLDNREARINQGTMIPFSQVSAMGVQTVFQEAKLQLIVKPHVTADGSVSMHVQVSRDEPDFNQTSARGDPTILKRQAETDLLIMDGHTAVIGGIYTRNTGRNLDQVPFFGDIPILGLLFQRRRASDTRQELVIFLTPRIVNRAEALGR